MVSEWTSLTSQWKTESEEIAPHIFIPSNTYAPAFNRDIKVLFEKVVANPIGKRLLEKIRLCSSEIYIFYGNKDETIWAYEENRDFNILYPVLISLSMKDSQCFSSKGEAIPLPNYVILFHELTHAYHNLSGKRAHSQFCDPLIWESDEEYKTIMGFPSKKGKTTAKITENAFRKAEGLPERFGSWGPLEENKKIHVCQSLFESRIKILGEIHERNKALFPDNFSPPPLALCSRSDLGLNVRWILFFHIQGEKEKLSEGTPCRIFLCCPSNYPMEDSMGASCYKSLDADPQNIKKYVIFLYPKLKDIDFKILCAMSLFLSEKEFGVLTA